MITGGTGTIVQIIALYFYRLGLGYQIANFLSIETAIVSNFTLSNLWTFSDRRLLVVQIPGKFLQFNLASAGSILIQMIIAFMGEKFIGLHTLFIVPIAGINVDTGMTFPIVGILVGMF
ncbi:GtrA family protein, partial [bacterium]|nr:GtrA family protein [bacterium]